MEWLESISGFSGTIMVISHDHFFLIKIAMQIASSNAVILIFIKEFTLLLKEKESVRRFEE
jgi:ATPase subunit of ABC transporter with duplicated ATPase domains